MLTTVQLVGEELLYASIMGYDIVYKKQLSAMAIVADHEGPDDEHEIPESLESFVELIVPMLL